MTFQAQNRLFVCDPLDGSLLWQRNDLEPNGGLYAHVGSGITGDERCLVVFGAGLANYSLYDARTGKLLRTGRLDWEQPQTRHAFGRKILRISRDRGQWIGRVWDPWDERWELEVPLGDRNSSLQPISSTEVVWLTPRGGLKGYDVPRSRPTLNVQFPEGEMDGLNSLRAIRDKDRYYVNLQRNTPSAQTWDHNRYADNTIARCIHVRDDLYGVDGPSGRVLWKRTIPYRTLLRLDPPGLPFLVLLSRIHDRHDGNRQSLLVEIVDAETGRLLGRKEQLPVDQIVHADYDGEERMITLLGVKTKIHVQLYFDGASEALP
jgi:hypothetical protein